MTDISQSPQRFTLKNIDKAWLALGLILLAVAILDLPQLQPTVTFALGALTRTAPYIAFAVLAVAYMKATGAENLLPIRAAVLSHHFDQTWDQAHRLPPN